MSAALNDQAARDRITGELESNLGVEAGAGTGKTTVLVERITNVLATGKATVDELVVITFTEKAAAELSTRVRDALDRRARTSSGPERKRVLEAARDLYRCHIETIHSFAAGLLRERPVEAGLDPLFDVVDGLAGSLSFDAAYEAFQDELLSSSSPELDRGLRRGLGLDELREACELINEYRYLRPLEIPANDDAGLAACLAEFRRISDELAALLAACDPGEDKAVEIVEGIIDWVAELEALESEAEQEFELLYRPAAKTHLGAGAKAKWGDGKARLTELQADYRGVHEAAQDTLRTDALLSLLPRIEQFVDDYEQQRRKDGEPDFDDLLFWASELLRTSRPARDYFHRRYKVVLIDEFQDTDPVQTELALLLTSNDEPNGDWRDLRPTPSRLMVVGDPKQSIYRFRRADIAVYDEVKSNALRGAQEQISTNFRSNPQMLAALNAVFDKVFEQQAGVQPANVRLAAPPQAQRARRPPIVLALGELDPKSKADDVRREEARTIAALLHTAHEAEWEIRDRRHGGRWRACRWGDMAILMPARTGIERYEEALADAGIPYRHEGSRDFYQRQEVRDLIWVLAAIDDPTDRLALVGALRSSAFAINDEDLIRHRAGAGSLSYRSTSEGPIAAVNEALSELSNLHRLRTRFSLAETVRRVVERTRLVEFALTRADGDQGAANLLGIVDQARLFAAAGGGGLRPFIRYLRDSMADEQIEIDATVAEETDDVVRIMTVHGAKGLEYPIVALANLAGRNPNHAQPVPREEERFLHFRVGARTSGRHGHFKTPGYDDAWEAEKQYIEAERLRLLYVAATRAREHLIVPCVAGIVGAAGLLAPLVHNLPNDEALVQRVNIADLGHPAVEEIEPAPVTGEEIARGVAERESWLAGVKQLKRTASEPRKIEIASSRERARGPLAAEVATFDAALLIGDGPPIPIGDAVHMVMERISLPDAHNLEQIADDVCKEGAITGDTADVISMCRACLDSPSVRHARELGTLWREVPFMINHARAGEPAERAPLTNGRVDLVVRDGDELIVVDYKTDKGITEDNAVKFARDHHAGQGEAYIDGLGTATGLSVREVVFVYCRAGVEVSFRAGGALSLRQQSSGVRTGRLSAQS
jgi:ATP-dependent exoDNAse (exonuclease V) beta subunit